MYFEVFAGLVSAVAPAAVSTTVKCAIERYFSRKEVRQGSPTEKDKEVAPAETDIPLIAIPLAIGYYYNFIEKIEERLAGDNFTVKRHYFQQGSEVLDKAGLNNEQLARFSRGELDQLRSNKIELADFAGRFEIDAVSIELVYPKDLSNPTLRKCSRYLAEKTNRGSIESTAGRPYGINYYDFPPGNREAIRIVDYTRPVEVIPRFYEEVRGLGRLGSDDAEWKEIEDKEMQSFLFTLKKLIEGKARFLFDKVYYRPYED
jgi:hypothetical protein